MHLLEVQNNLMCLPTTTNVPALLAMRVTNRASSPSGAGSSRVGLVTCNGGSGATSSAAPISNVARRDPGAQVRNPNRDARFVVNTPLARLLQSH
jgi:hypothetical protein